MLDWSIECDMGKAPDKDKCPECGAKCEQNFSTPTLIFKGDFYTNKRKNHNLVHHDKKMQNEVQENLLDIAKKSSEAKVSPYRNIGVKKEWMEKAVSRGLAERKKKP